MYLKSKITTSGLALAVLAASTGITFAGDHANYCMDVEIEPFHMMSDPNMTDGSCTVPKFWGGELQEAFYPFTKEEHLFNCEYFGPGTPLPTGQFVPSAVVSQGKLTGTIGGYPFEVELACASLTNWYQDSCTDSEDPTTCGFQLAQPFAKPGVNMPPNLFPRVTEVSIFDGLITVGKGRKAHKVPIVMATRAAGITHLEVLIPDDPMATQVGASVTHSLLGMVTYDARGGEDRDFKVLDGTADLLLQGHIFYPTAVEDDDEAAVIKGSICSEDLYKQLNRKKKGHGHGHGHGGGHHDDDSHHDDD